MHRLLLPLLAAALLALPFAQGRNYYVFPSGSDGAAGTLDQPFQTIQKAASLMVAGDTAYIRAGVYRETVTPKSSGTQNAPVTFMPYSGESVTVSGADVIPVSSWTLSSGNIYKAKVGWDLGEGANQVFLDGQMMIEARWPNTTLDVSHPTAASSSGGSFVNGGTALSMGTFTDPSLPPRSAGYWNGATIHMNLGSGWDWQTGTVVSSAESPPQLSFTFTKLNDALTPGPDNPHYITGKLGELDSAAEWFLDSASSMLYFWTPASDNPAQHLVEAKHRQLAFDLRGRSLVTIQGIAIFGATVYSDDQSQYLTLDGLKVTYVSHYSVIPAAQPLYSLGVTDGILLEGQHNILRNSTIAFCPGIGVNVAGFNHGVFNNVIHDCDYMATESAPVTAGEIPPSSRITIAYNTLYNTGRSGIEHAFGGGRILHNEIYNVALQTSDTGCTYTYGSDGMGTEIAYNLCHDNKALHYGNGIYLDNDSSNYIVHHNVVWNTLNSSALNSASTNNKSYNNTFAGTDAGLTVYSMSGPARMPGTELENNIFTAPIPATPGAVRQNNIFSTTDPQFIDAARGNFQLMPTSPAIGAGAIIPPYTDGFSGSAPDIGAFDHNKPAWKAGVQAAAYTASAPNYGTSLAPGSAAVVFGTVPFDQGVSVLVTDSAGADLPATLLYSVASPAQLAFEVPSAAAPGIAMITIANGDGTISLSSAPVFPVAPGLFSADATGQGIAAAGTLRVKADGTQSYGPVDVYDATQGRYVAIPIDLSSATDQVFLVLYGTGLRGRSSLSGVIVSVGGVNTQVFYAGSQNQFPGLDQLDVLLPNSLAGKGSASIVLTVDGQPANSVTVTIK